MVNEEFSENDASETPEEEPKVHYDVFYRCLRCGTHASNTELDKLPLPLKKLHIEISKMHLCRNVDICRKHHSELLAPPQCFRSVVF